MSRPNRCLFLAVYAMCLSPLLLPGQDPFFTSFLHSESYFNPALTGYRGALSVMAKYKTQWNRADVNGFQTASLTLEESMPCSVFDYGLHFGADREGEGLLTTTDFGGRIAGTIAWDAGYTSHNLRFGLGMLWAAKRVDYSRLIFSDQLDPKYGTVNPDGIPNATSFVPFNDGRSLWFMTPALGFTHRILLHRQKFRSPTIHYGISLHNAFSLGNKRFAGNIESILEQDTRIPARLHVFLMSEFILVANGRSFISMRPLAAYQLQGPISYYELGNRVSLNRHMGVGLYYHFNFRNPTLGHGNTNWYVIQADFGSIVSRNRRIELGLSYAGNFSGLRNSLGPILEVSMAVHFASSPSCQMWGLQDEVPYGEGIRCPTSSITQGRRKMYEGIWYK